MLSPHELDPGKGSRLATALGGSCKQVLLVACEPLTFGGEQGIMGLSEPVAAALDAAVAHSRRPVYELTGAERHEAAASDRAENPDMDTKKERAMNGWEIAGIVIAVIIVLFR